MRNRVLPDALMLRRHEEDGVLQAMRLPLHYALCLAILQVSGSYDPLMIREKEEW